jgi:hypothetical protein
LHWLGTQPGSAKLLAYLKLAIQQKVWKVVIQLVRLGIPQEDLEELLRQMVDQMQWAVCRVLLETCRLPQRLCVRVAFATAGNPWAVDAGVQNA